jgi:hypothetical protein
MLWKTYRDQLTLILFVILIGFIAYTYVIGRPMPDILIGAVIAWIGQIVTFYYRKRTAEEVKPPEAPPSQ